MPNSLLQALELRDTLTADERAAVLGAASSEVDFQAGQDIVKEGARPNACSLVVSGLAARYIVLAAADASSPRCMCLAISSTCRACS